MKWDNHVYMHWYSEIKVPKHYDVYIYVMTYQTSDMFEMHHFYFKWNIKIGTYL